MPTSLRVLDIDIENRPLAYLGQDYTTGEITAIGSCWHGHPKTMQAWLLGLDDPRAMLEAFLRRYAEADIVTGHYIRAHDLPVINGALMEYGLPTLGPKLTIDTKVDLKDRKYISASMENMAEMLGLADEDREYGHKKVHMSNAMWREANRLTLAGLELTKARVVGDIKLHMKLREELVRRDLLNAPQVWRP